VTLRGPFQPPPCCDSGILRRWEGARTASWDRAGFHGGFRKPWFPRMCRLRSRELGSPTRWRRRGLRPSGARRAAPGTGPCQRAGGCCGRWARAFISTCSRTGGRLWAERGEIQTGHREKFLQGEGAETLAQVAQSSG